MPLKEAYANATNDGVADVSAANLTSVNTTLEYILNYFSLMNRNGRHSNFTRTFFSTFKKVNICLLSRIFI
jgi:hypothetical protein